MHKVMKLISKIIFSTLICINVSCGQKPASAKSNATIKVTDIYGVPLVGIGVGGTYIDEVDHTQGFGRATFKSTAATTNHLGLASVSNHTRSRGITFGIRKSDGYYDDHGIKFDYTSQSLRVWQPDNPLIEFKLKPIKNPIPLYAKNVDTKIPARNKSCGYDLLVGDWVSPQGSGQQSDIIFLYEGEYRSHLEYHCEVKIQFDNKHDGIISDPKPLNVGSILRLAYEAPKEGYLTELEKKFIRTEEKGIKIYDISETANYYLRVRTKVDDDGKIISANFAKIHGDIKCFPGGVIQFNYYYNPKPNDRNLEFDMKRNLFKNLTDFEAPLAP